MLHGWLHRIVAWWRVKSTPEQPVQLPSTSPKSSTQPRLERIILCDGVARTLFESFQTHRQSARGEEEIGWVLLGVRQDDHAIALAALPAGTQREAGVAHILFNRDAQELASRILRQNEKRLTIIGVVHTHPGNLRHPSEGDFQGDRLWVGQLRSGEGVFGIGTADVGAAEPAVSDYQQYYQDLCFSWYALGQQDVQYRRLPVQVTNGADLAHLLHAIWDLLEVHAKPLNSLCRQLTRVHFEIVEDKSDTMLVVHIPLWEAQQQLRLLLNDHEARYYIDRQSELIAVDPNEPQLLRAVFLILAELAKEWTVTCEAKSLVES
jgi:proteasome lid subunit RPN8/RPN11